MAVTFQGDIHLALRKDLAERGIEQDKWVSDALFGTVVRGAFGLEP